VSDHPSPGFLSAEELQEIREDLDQLIPPDLPARSEQREGLPGGYRMRADRHYVDQLTDSETAAPAVRMLRLNQLEDGPPLDENDLRPLIESIRAQGIVQPLLVRPRGGRFSVIGGHRRLAAARVLQVPGVPCIVHDADDKQAAALAAADNLTRSAAASAEIAERTSSIPPGAHRAIADHLSAIQTCTGSLLNRPNNPFARPVTDLVAAHAWRAARLIDALEFVTHGSLRAIGDRSLSAIAGDVVSGFAAESHLNGFSLRAEVADDVSSWHTFNNREVFTGLSAAVLAVLPVAEEAVGPSIQIKIGTGEEQAIVVEIIQPDVPVLPATAASFFDESAQSRPGGAAATLGMLAARRLAMRYGGTATFETQPRGGYILKLSLVRRS
jgi:hypothetical protein